MLLSWDLILLDSLIMIELASKADGPKILMYSTIPIIRKYFLEIDQSFWKLQLNTCFLKIQKWNKFARLTLKIKTYSLTTSPTLTLKWVNSVKKNFYSASSKTINQDKRSPKAQASNSVHSLIPKNTERFHDLSSKG